MKKLITLALVLGVVGLANAGLSLDKVDAKTASLVNASDTIVGANYYITVSQTLTDYVITLNANSNPTGGSTIGAKEVYGDGLDWYFLTFITTDGSKPMKAGEWLNVVAKAGKGEVQMWDATGMETITSAVTVVPEPMTMALLALGGLFVRRK